MPFHTNGFQILPLRLSNRQRLGSYLYVILLLANICSLLTTDFLSSLYHYSPTRDCYNSIKSCGLLINSTRLRPVPSHYQYPHRHPYPQFYHELTTVRPCSLSSPSEVFLTVDFLGKYTLSSFNISLFCILRHTDLHLHSYPCIASHDTQTRNSSPFIPLYYLARYRDQRSTSLFLILYPI